MSQQTLTYFDSIAELTADPDINHLEIRRRFAADPGLTVPATVFNSMLQRRDRMPQE